VALLPLPGRECMTDRVSEFALGKNKNTKTTKKTYQTILGKR
jgi:hypothetical protein